jgi:hypothetical protein
MKTLQPLRNGWIITQEGSARGIDPYERSPMTEGDVVRPETE